MVAAIVVSSYCIVGKSKFLILVLVDLIVTGNVKFRNFIADCRKSYEKAKRGEKLRLAQEIVDTVKQSSGLFLKGDGANGWVVVDDASACSKVGAVFRTLRTIENSRYG